MFFTFSDKLIMVLQNLNLVLPKERKNMACFLVPMALAIITTTIQKTARSLAEKLKLGILNALLWGGVILLALEHVWHAEVTPWPPFLTAMANPSDIPVMLHEMATVGTAMSMATLAIWGTILTITSLMPKMVVVREMKRVEKPLTRP
jgi:uncharacterized membrane protein (DUF2068 family)